MGLLLEKNRKRWPLQACFLLANHQLELTSTCPLQVGPGSVVTTVSLPFLHLNLLRTCMPPPPTLGKFEFVVPFTLEVKESSSTKVNNQLMTDLRFPNTKAV